MIVTVYIPTRNRQALVERAVNSVLGQDHREIELIVVDDGSTDTTPAYLKAAAAADPRMIALFNDKPMGAPVARNRAIAQARGEFVTGLDDDDAFAGNRISSFIAAWHDYAARGITPSGLYSHAVAMRAGTESLWKRPPSAQYQDLFRLNVVGNQLFAPRAHYHGVGMFDEQLPAWQDLDLFIRILLKYGPAYLADAPSYLYDDEDRGDRISSKAERIRNAYARISAKHRDLDPRLNLALFMQIFQDGYDIWPDWHDLTHVLGSRPTKGQVKRIILKYLRAKMPRRRRYD
ncbi:glycosyltransferase [Dongia sp.]|uniref:glycosyltransferase n=1 Tax=Dongia sp. TaxID=1977262 RepID=UPI00374FF426